MAFALIIIGVVFLVTAIKGTSGDLFNLLRADFVGQNNFVYWMAAILIIGAVGYIPKARPVSTGLLVLVVTVLFLKNGNSGAPGGGFFAELSQGLASTQTAPNTTTAAATGTGTTAAAQYPNSIISRALSALGLNPNMGLPSAVTPPIVAAPANPSIFPPPAAGTAPEPTLSQLGALPSLSSMVQ